MAICYKSIFHFLQRRNQSPGFLAFSGWLIEGQRWAGPRGGPLLGGGEGPARYLPPRPRLHEGGWNQRTSLALHCLLCPPLPAQKQFAFITKATRVCLQKDSASQPHGLWGKFSLIIFL